MTTKTGDRIAARTRMISAARIVCAIALVGMRDGRAARAASPICSAGSRRPRKSRAAASSRCPRSSRTRASSTAPAICARPSSRRARTSPTERACVRACAAIASSSRGSHSTRCKMVGTFKVGNNFYGLVQSKDGLVHKVQPGNYLGQNDGKVTEITGSRISLVEIIPDGLGGYIERPASLALTRLMGPQGEQRMTRFKIRMAMIGAMALAALSAFALKTQAQGADALKLESVDVQTLSEQPGPAQAASERPGSRAAAVHHRQAGAHRVRLAEHLARAPLAPHRRALGRRRFRARRRGERPLAPRGERRSAAALHDQGRRQHHHRHPGPPAGRCPGECRDARDSAASAARRSSAPSRPSISAAARTAPAA